MAKNISFYDRFYVKADKSKDAKIGTLQDEIVLYKVLLKRYLESYDSDPKYIRALTNLADTIKELEIAHAKLTGTSNEGPTEFIVEVRRICKAVGQSICPEEPK
jgi:hypothetical protein